MRVVLVEGGERVVVCVGSSNWFQRVIEKLVSLRKSLSADWSEECSFVRINEYLYLQETAMS